MAHNIRRRWMQDQIRGQSKVVTGADDMLCESVSWHEVTNQSIRVESPVERTDIVDKQRFATRLDNVKT